MNSKELETTIAEMMEDDDINPIRLIRFIIQSIAEDQEKDEIEILDHMICGLAEE